MSLVINLVLLVLTIIILNFLKDKKIKIILMGITVLFTILANLFFSLNLIIWLVFYGVIILIGRLLGGKEKGEKIEKQKNESSLSLRIICFLIPLVGLIVYAVNIVQNPKIAKECGKWALMGFIVGFAIMVTIFVIQFA